MRRTVSVVLLAALLAWPAAAPASRPSGDPEADRFAALAMAGVMLSFATGSVASIVNGLTILDGEASETGIWEWAGIASGALFAGLLVAASIRNGEVLPDEPGQLRAVLLGYGLSAAFAGLGVVALSLPEPKERALLLLPGAVGPDAAPGVVLSAGF